MRNSSTDSDVAPKVSLSTIAPTKIDTSDLNNSTTGVANICTKRQVVLLQTARAIAMDEVETKS